MFKRLFIGTAAVLLAGAVFAQVYKWTDEDGQVHYSDRSHPGAELVQLPTSRSPSRTTSRRAPSSSRSTRAVSSSSTDGADDKAFAYETLIVASPAAEETLWNIESVLNVMLDVRPGLQAGHQVRVYFDGTARFVDGTSFQIEEVYRGVHNLQAEILDENGKMMIRSLPNRFYVQQNIRHRRRSAIQGP